MTVKMMFPEIERANVTTQQLFGLVNLEETILMETHKIYVDLG